MKEKEEKGKKVHNEFTSRFSRHSPMRFQWGNNRSFKTICLGALGLRHTLRLFGYIFAPVTSLLRKKKEDIHSLFSLWPFFPNDISVSPLRLRPQVNRVISITKLIFYILYNNTQSNYCIRMFLDVIVFLEKFNTVSIKLVKFLKRK